MRLLKILTSILLLTLLVSCVPKKPKATQPVEQLPASVTLVSTSAPPATQKPPRGTKVPGGQQGQGQGQGSDASQSVNFDLPEHPFDVILGRPTVNSITLSVMSATAQTLAITYGAESGDNATQTAAALQPNSPTILELSNLQPDTAYYYTVNNGERHTFHTARASGSSFTFTIQADSHLDSNSSLQVYQQALTNQRADKPDFAIDLGDTFMTDKYKPYTNAESQYLAQRYYLSLLGQDVPLFLVLGNHDGEGAPRGNPDSSTGKGNAGDEMSVWSAKLRTMLFPNPVPNDFYTGNDTPNSSIGALQDYYAWEWGDALFIALDPYWFTPPLRNDSSLWTPTLGETQYQWLKNTLETSDAKWKFVFIHQLISGYDKNGRGGVEVAPFYEWGGNNPDGTYAFDQYRPDWGVPIHQLLITNNVTAVFHGHDHLFVKQELDGIIYQEVPQPSAARADNTNSAIEYCYLNGDVLSGTGHIRVSVAPNQVTVDFVRADVGQDGQAVHSYTVPAP